jgi:FMN phosphatase YigB (HAD superfamily)
MKILDSYLNKIQGEQITTSAAAGITPYDSFPGVPAKKKPLIKSVFTEQEVEAPKRIMVDFDGTVHKYSKGYFNAQIYDVPTDDAKEALQFLKNEGFEIVIYTTRLSQELHPETYKVNEQAIRNWMDRYGIPFDRITAEKLLALIYIDDNGFRFSNWKDNIQFLKIL